VSAIACGLRLALTIGQALKVQNKVKQGTHILPKSLFGRLVLILLLGLILAQLLSAAILLKERDKALYHYGDLQWAERDAGVVALMESMGSAARHKIAAVLTTPGLRVSLRQRPLPTTGPGIGIDPPAADFEATLKRILGPNRALRVVVTRQASRYVPAGQRRFKGQRIVDRRQHVITQVKLRGGKWISFDHPRRRHMDDWPYRLLVSLGILLISVIVLAAFAVHWVTRPLSALAAAAEGLGRNIHQPPMPETGPLEVRHAARAFNTMQARLARFIEDRMRILAAVSHDLKTPITRLRLRTELLDDEALRAKFVQDLAEMETMTQAALNFMRGIEAREPAQPIDIMALVESVQSDAEELGGNVAIRGRAEHAYAGRPQALKRCLENLLSNALAYGRRALIVVNDEAEVLRITVRDAGPGIPEEKIEKVFEPFYRLEGSRNRETGGTGLGLAIARNIVAAHGGTLTLVNRAEGGLDAVLTLPRRRTADRAVAPHRATA
jgi:signal transduction histidine kinase